MRNAVSGSGFIITQHGYILTNYHVIDGVSDIKVTLYDGSTYDAKLVGGEEENDIVPLMPPRAQPPTPPARPPIRAQHRPTATNFAASPFDFLGGSGMGSLTR